MDNCTTHNLQAMTISESAVVKSNAMGAIPFNLAPELEQQLLGARTQGQIAHQNNIENNQRVVSNLANRPLYPTPLHSIPFHST